MEANPPPEQDRRVVTYGSDAFSRAVEAVGEAIDRGEGRSFLFVGASEDQKKEGLMEMARHGSLNVHQFKVPNLIGERLVDTQGNLREAFDHAGEKAALLFFDDADVLFDPSFTEEADEEDTALSEYFFQRVEAFSGVTIVCFSSQQYVSQIEEHRPDVVVEC